MPAFPNGPQDHAEAVVVWARETCPQIVNDYSYATATKAELPDVVVEIEGFRDSYTDDRFPVQLQQIEFRVYDVMLSIMVDNGNPETAAALLRDMAAALHDAAREDATLGGRVFLTARDVETDFVPQFVRYDDGTQGRQVQVRIAIAQLLPE